MTTAVEPRPAATVVLLRAGARGPEVLMVRRHRGSSFMADAYVFPGAFLKEATPGKRYSEPYVMVTYVFLAER